MRVELLKVNDYADKHKKKKETKLQYFNRVLSEIFTASYQIVYRKDKYIAKDKDGKLMLLHKIEEGKDVW